MFFSFYIVCMTIVDHAKELVHLTVDPEALLVEEKIKADLLEQKKQIVNEYIDHHPELLPSVLGINLRDKENLVDYLISDGIKDTITDNLWLSAINTRVQEHDLMYLHEKITSAQTQTALHQLKQELGLDSTHQERVQTATGTSEGTQIWSSWTVTSLQEDHSKEQQCSSQESSLASKNAIQSAILPATFSSQEKTSSAESLSSIWLQYEHLTWSEKPDFKPFLYAVQGYEQLKSKLNNQRYLTIVDYSKSNQENRFFVIDMETNTVKYALPVGHGKNSGWEFARSFSNVVGSNQSSLGFFRTPQKITKARTKSWKGLLLKGIEESNDKATERGIYIHPSTVSGSEGCFTLPKQASEVMETIKWDALLFAYYPEQQYFAQSKLVDTTSQDVSHFA